MRSVISKETFGGGLPLHERGELELLHVSHQTWGRICWRLGEGCRQSDRDGRLNGFRSSEGGCAGTSQGYRGCERGQPCDVEGGLRGHQRGTRPHDCLGARKPNNGRLQCLLRAGVPAEVPQYLMSTVNEADAKRAYSALMQFKDVVKANP